MTWYMVPAAPWDIPKLAVSPDAGQVDGPVCAAGDAVGDGGATDVLPLELAWTVTVLVGAAAPGAAVLPQAVSIPHAAAAAAAADIHPVRVSERAMDQFLRTGRA
jgi:hypothetical protein